MLPTPRFPTLPKHLALPMAILFLAAVASLPARAQIAGCTPDFSNSIVIDVETSLGTIPIELYPEMAPLTVANFLAYANRGDFDGTLFHRSVPGFVIQGGGFREGVAGYEAVLTDPPLLNEPCLSNTRGTVAMARLGGQPNSATNQWFVNLTDNVGLDSSDGVGFTAFARVVGDGMDVADAIAAQPIFDALGILELPFNQIFTDMPLQSLPLEPPGGYGCTRSIPAHGLLTEAQTALVIDPLRHGSTTLVPILLDPQCTGAGATGSPSVPCVPGAGRAVAAGTLATGIYLPPAIPVSCDQVAEAEDSWAARRAGTAPQLFEQDIEIKSVPEPAAWLQLLGGVGLLVTLARRRA